MTNFGQYMHFKYHNAIFSMKNRKKLVEVGGYGLANGRIWEKKINA